MYSKLNDTEIVILGEAIIDMLPTPDGDYRPYVGGSPYNVARALGLQKVPVAYLSPMSCDDFGKLLMHQLQEDGVAVDTEFLVDKPTSLAVVNLDDTGSPRYSLYRQGIADRDFSSNEIVARLPKNLKVFHTGSLALTPGDLSRMIEIFDVLKGRGILISVDLNLRPNAVKDLNAYIDGLNSIIPFCDILKASDEDLRHMGIDKDLQLVAKDYLEIMKGGLVAFTAGKKGSLLANNNSMVNMGAYRVSRIGDSVGAGDCFHAGLIASLYKEHRLEKNKLATTGPESLSTCLKWASATAAINVSRKGCNPPAENDIEAFIKSSLVA